MKHNIQDFNDHDLLSAILSPFTATDDKLAALRERNKRCSCLREPADGRTWLSETSVSHYDGGMYIGSVKVYFDQESFVFRPVKLGGV
tara:strand:+ start:858 stop:1121 length:264 start_codon:yes stop_codon:yes gene_type:complete